MKKTPAMKESGILLQGVGYIFGNTGLLHQWLQLSMGAGQRIL